MRDTREILRQKWLLGRSHRAIAESLGVSAGVVGLAARRAGDASLDWSATPVNGSSTSAISHKLDSASSITRFLDLRR